MTAERLISVAQRLDELAEEHDLPELATLSEEMGLVAERWPREQPSGVDPDEMLRYLRYIFEIAEREMRSGRANTRVTWNGNGFERDNAYQMYMARLPVMTQQAAITAALTGP